MPLIAIQNLVKHYTLTARTFPPRAFRSEGSVPEPMAERTRSSGVHRNAATLAAAAVVAAMLAVSGSALAAEPQFTPLGASVPAPPQPVRATDGRVHLVYEITLLSIELGGTVPTEVQSLDVRVRGGRTLLRLAGSELVMTTGLRCSSPARLRPAQAARCGSTWRCRAATGCRARSFTGCVCARTIRRQSDRARSRSTLPGRA